MINFKINKSFQCFLKISPKQINILKILIVFASYKLFEQVFKLKLVKVI